MPELIWPLGFVGVTYSLVVVEGRFCWMWTCENEYVRIQFELDVCLMIFYRLFRINGLNEALQINYMCC